MYQSKAKSMPVSGKDLLIPMLFCPIQGGKHDGKNHFDVFVHLTNEDFIAPHVERSFGDLEKQ